MNDLKSKYINNELSSDELLELRSAVNASSDSEISSEMEQRWTGYNESKELLPAEFQNKIMVKIHKTNNRLKGFRFLRYAAVSIAAILIPMLIGTTIYLYKEVQYEGKKRVEISTGVGERANVVLPDGTKVSLNFESQLSYSPYTFGKEERGIEFNGEAYFDVAHNKNSKFIISNDDVSVQVIGTKFDLSSRSGTQFVKVCMEEGKVAFSVLYGKKQCELVENQRAIFDRNTGNILVTDFNKKDVAAWRHNELIFRNITFSEVLKTISSNYGVKVEIEGVIPTGNDLFTGSISSTNLLEAMDIVERAYHVNATILNNDVKITATN
ncbi:MAG: FecR domain-containing protein [Rikenellaceae bacterium]